MGRRARNQAAHRRRGCRISDRRIAAQYQTAAPRPPSGRHRQQRDGRQWAIDQHTANAHAAHLAERDIERTAVCVRWYVAFWARHCRIEARRSRESNCRFQAARNQHVPLPMVGAPSKEAPEGEPLPNIQATPCANRVTRSIWK